MPTKVVGVATNGSGVASQDVRLYGVLHSVAIRLGTLSTPDLEITDHLTSAVVLDVAAVAADTAWYPRVEVTDAEATPIADAYDRYAITGVLRIAIAGGGANKAGEIVLTYQ